MRQFFSWRIWVAFGALIGLTLLLKAWLPTDAAPSTAAEPGAVDATAATRSVDFISLIYQIEASSDFAVIDGVVLGSARLIIDGQRTMQVVQGTLGSNTCPEYTELARCVVLADLLGDAVVWFAIVPVEPGAKVSLPPVVDLLGNGVVQLANGWLVRTAKTIEYKCPQETASLAEFVSRFGPASTTVIDVSKQSITAVKCSPDVKSSG